MARKQALQTWNAPSPEPVQQPTRGRKQTSITEVVAKQDAKEEAAKPKRAKKPDLHVVTKNLPVPRKNTLPANWEEEMERDAVNTAAAEAKVATGIFFNTRGGQLTYQGNPMQNNTMDVVILASLFERRYYEGKFDPDQLTSPKCYSFSEDGEDMAPHEESHEKQHAVCKGCWANEWKTADGGARKGKACGEVRRLAVIPESGLKNADAVENSEIGILRVPVTSVAAWASHAKALASSQTKPVYAFITTITVKPDVKKQFVVTFAVKKQITDKSILKAVYMRRQVALDHIQQPYAEYVEQVAPAPRKQGKRKY